MKILLLDVSAKSEDKKRHGGEINTLKYSTDEETAGGKMFQHKRHGGFSSRVNLYFLQLNNIRVKMRPQNSDKSGFSCLGTKNHTGEH